MRRYDAIAETIGTMVWCQSCDTVVWALDSDQGDLRGILNMLRIPCRLCQAVGNYDQYSANTNHMKDHGAYDGWSTMKALANMEELEWNPSPDNTWRSDAEIELARSRRILEAFGPTPKEEVPKP